MPLLTSEEGGRHDPIAAGAHATPGSGLPFVGLSAAQVAASIGPAA